MTGNQNSAQDKATDTAKANLDRTAAQGARLADSAQNGVDKMTELREQTAENTRHTVQSTIKAAPHQAREVGERFSRNFGVNSEDSQRLAEQSKQNLEAIPRCGNALTQAFQDVSRSWIELSQQQWQRNLDGLSRLTRSRSAKNALRSTANSSARTFRASSRTDAALRKSRFVPLRKLAKPSPMSCRGKRDVVSRAGTRCPARLAWPMRRGGRNDRPFFMRAAAFGH